MSEIIIDIKTNIYKDKLSINIEQFPQKEIKLLLKEHKDYLKVSKDSSYKVINYFVEEKKVPDTWRYTIVKEKDSFILKEHKKEDEKIIDKSKFGDMDAVNIPDSSDSIVLVLESPHKGEYSKDFEPLVPANGATGTHIKKYICDYILPLMEKDFNIKLEGSYNLILSNPIQYQTSLYEIIKKPLSNKTVKKLRDLVWDNIFNIQEFKKDFKNRLILYNPKIIINGCTSSLKGRVENFIKEDFMKSMKESAPDYLCPVFKTPHPSSWYITRNRKLTI